MKKINYGGQFIDKEDVKSVKYLILSSPFKSS